jgi:TetR/AcrR family transcriptional repressor of mexJK operon
MTEIAESVAVRDDPKEEIILAAAKAAFLELGYAATSMDHVAQRAKASKTTLYTRFPSKEALFGACISAECHRRGLDFAPENFLDLPIEQALTRIGTLLTDLLWSYEALRVEQVVTGEANRFPEVAEIFFKAGPERVMEAVGAFFAMSAASGRLAIKPEDAGFHAGQFITAMKGKPYCELIMGLRTDVPPDERADYIEKVVALFLDGVRVR